MERSLIGDEGLRPPAATFMECGCEALVTIRLVGCSLAGRQFRRFEGPGRELVSQGCSLLWSDVGYPCVCVAQPEEGPASQA